jgi:hypothetical protein
MNVQEGGSIGGFVRGALAAQQAPHPVEATLSKCCTMKKLQRKTLA